MRHLRLRGRLGTARAAIETVGIVLGAALGCGGSEDEADAGASHVQVLPAWGNAAPALQVTLPTGFQVVTEKGADFDVHHIFDSTAAGRDARRRIGVYVGHHPALYVEQDRPTATSAVGGQIAGREVRWVCWENAARGGFCEARAEGVFAGRAGRGVSNLLLHAWVGASTTPDLAELRRLAASVQVVP